MNYEDKEKRDRTPYEISERRKQPFRSCNPATYRSEHAKLIYNTRGEKSETQSKPNQNFTARLYSPNNHDASLSDNNTENYASKL